MSKKGIIFIVVAFVVCVVTIVMAKSIDNNSAINVFKRTIDDVAERFGVIEDGDSVWTTVDAGDVKVSDMVTDIEVQESIIETQTESIVETARGTEKTVETIVSETTVPVDDGITFSEGTMNINPSSQSSQGSMSFQNSQGKDTSEDLAVGIAETIASSGNTQVQQELDVPITKSTIEDITFDQYMAMSPAQKNEFMSLWEDPDAYVEWYEKMMDAHNNDPSIDKKVLGEDGQEDVSETQS